VDIVDSGLPSTAGCKPTKSAEQLRLLDRDDDSRDLWHRSECAHHALDHRAAAHLDQRLVTDARMGCHRVATDAGAG
jgi:hypothetical protein